MDFDKMSAQELRRHFEKVRKVFGEQKHKAVPIFDDVPCYPTDQVVQLAKLSHAIEEEFDETRWPDMVARFAALRDQLVPLEYGPQRIYLWPEGKMPSMTEYTDNSDYRFNHDPDFKPYMFALTVPDSVTPKGAVVVVPGGDQGDCTLTEGYQVCLDFISLGYQCFLLHNRVNHNPWCGQECGADAARAIRYVRAHAKEYRIAADHVAFAGFSNGGLTGEACIRYYSGSQTVAGHFDGYVPDELDAYDGAPDAFLCIYGPRLKGTDFDYTDVKYPPTFFAVGREDFAMENLHSVYPSLVEQGVPVEVHTFSATPHGKAGIRLLDGEVRYPNFELWMPLADAFMQDVYGNI